MRGVIRPGEPITHGRAVITVSYGIFPVESQPQSSPWWQVAPELIKYLSQQNQTPLLDNIIKYLQEHSPDIYFKFDQDILHKKIIKLLSENSISPDDRLIEKMIKRLSQ